MKKNKYLGIAVVVLLLGIIAAVSYKGISAYQQQAGEITSLNSEKADIQKELVQRDSMVNELLGAFNEIEENLRFIKEKRKVLSVESRKEGSVNKRQAIIEDIALMNEMLEKSSAHIAELEKKLKRSGIELSSFKKKIETLHQNISEQNNEIVALQNIIDEKDVQLAELSSTVDTLSQIMAQQNDTLHLKEHVIEEKIKALNKGFLALGTYKDLEAKGVVSKNGGFLGLGKQVSLQNNLEDAFFTELDIRNTTTIPLFTGKVKVISEHPDSSYRFVEEDGKIAYLEIEKPEEFWRISKYAVIELK